MSASFPCVEVSRRVQGRGRDGSTMRVLVPLPLHIPAGELEHLRRKVALLRATAVHQGAGGYGAWVVAPTARGENTSAMNVRRWMREGFVECRPVMVGRVRRLMFRITARGRSLLLRLEASLERIDRQSGQG